MQKIENNRNLREFMIYALIAQISFRKFGAKHMEKTIPKFVIYLRILL